MLQTAQQKGQERASMAARGVDLGQGSPLNVLTSTDLAGANAVIRTQQDAAMAAFGYRAQEAGAMIDAAGKRMQSGMVSIQSTLETGLTNTQATAIVANANAQADLQKALASIGLTTATADAAAKTAYAGADLTRATAQANTNRALALAGLDNAEAAAALKGVTANVLLENATAAANVKATEAAGINPSMSAESSLLTSASRVASTWYSHNKSVGG